MFGEVVCSMPLKLLTSSQHAEEVEKYRCIQKADWRRGESISNDYTKSQRALYSRN